MGRTPMSGGTAFRFLPAEVADMEKALDASNGATPARSIVETLADKFTNSSERSGQRPVQWKQVWNWFQNRRHAQKAKIDKLKGVGPGGETPPAAKPVVVAGPSAAKKPNVHVPMDFEAKSARDGAWYDVSAFINKRTGENGEPEVRVRFAGFGSEEDEWVNIATAVRQRSLPCETTECVAVLPGDLILCFQEGSEQALYFDADILDVQRRRHDVRGCRCRFWVRYRHDQTEEVVPLRKVCRRPETEQRLQQAREANASSNKFPNKDIVVEASSRPSNGTPNSIAAPPMPPTTPATPLQLSAAFTATPLPGASSNFHTPIQPGTTTPGLTPVQPLPMQPLNTPDVKSSIPHQAPPSNTAAAHQGTTPLSAVSASQGLLPSAPTAAVAQPMASTSAQQQTTPSIESSLAHQLSISAPAQHHAPPVSNAVEPVQQQLAPDVAAIKPGVSRASDEEAAASTGVPEIDNVGSVKPTPAVEQTGPSIVTQVDSSTTVGLSTGTSGGTAPKEEEKPLAGET